MAKRKYEGYITAQPKPDLIQDFFGPPAKGIRVAQVAYQDDDVIKGSFYCEGVWFLKCAGEISVHPHSHDFDEVLSFFGSDFEHPQALGGEVEFWYDNEQYIITQSCILFVPRGLKHCPLIFRRVDRPFFHFAAANTGIYQGKKR
jgi:hypothetical protein